ncbi:PspC domain-containing protein [Bifidobacterium sp. 82T24]|uniref:PspC domain-containing protein n=1 Tax=Bifidobacterium pluvialisilvae TaxID=2834436 RepID=UPI001C56CB1F|nr:PspC domain-containing protein [Bifidobacterium pluvialisilvae]MBW3088289.1 PspC domain-containing protein [Bifidobacterium pluvialisilvae]
MTSYNQQPSGGPKAPPYQPQQPNMGAGPNGAGPDGTGTGPNNGYRPDRPLGGGFFSWIRTLGFNRSSERWLGGVSGAIAGRLGWDPIIIRIIWFAFFCAAGFGALLYGLAWLLLPDERDGTILLEEALVGAKFPASFWIAIVMMIIGCPGSLFAIPFISIPVFIILVIVAAVLYNRDKSRNGTAGNGWAGGNSRATNTTGAAMPKAQKPYATYANASPAGVGPSGAPRQPFTAPQSPAPQFRPAPAMRPVPPVVYRRKPAGPVVVGVTSGLLILSLAALLWFLFFGGFADMPSPVMMICLWILGATFVLGIVTIIVGFSGRKSGGLIPITILALIASMCAYGAMPAYTAVANHVSGRYGESAIRTTAHYSSSDFYQLRSNGLQAVSSNVTVDLSDWRTVYPESSDCPAGDFPIDAMSSTVRVIIPNNCQARSNMNLMFGTASTYNVSGASDVSNDLVLVGDAAFSSVSVTNTESASNDAYTDPYEY